MTGYELHFIQLYCSAKHINLSVMYLCRKVKSRWGLVQFKLQTELRHLKSWFISQFFKVVIYWTHFVAQLNILALQCQAADFWNYQAKNEPWSASLWHTDISGMDLLSLNMLCKTVRTGEKKQNTKKTVKRIPAQQWCSKQISTRSSWNITITLLCLDFDIQRAFVSSGSQQLFPFFCPKRFDV